MSEASSRPAARPAGRRRRTEPGRRLARRIGITLTISLAAANLTGAAIAVAMGIFVLPMPEGIEDEGTMRAVIAGAAAAYLLVFIPIGAWWSLRRLGAARRWLSEDRLPSAQEREVVLGAPRRIVTVHAVLWGLAALLFWFLNALFSLEAALRAAILVAFAGVSTCVFVYLIAERQLRPAAARALAGGIGDRHLAPGIATRMLLAWALGSVVPVLGLMLIGVSTLIDRDFTAHELAVLTIVLGAIAVIVGAAAVLLAAHAVADPIVGLRRAVRAVESGDLEVELPVYDGSEVGRLQAGFNSMVAGLRERERLADLFGRQVGEDVARAALEEHVELGGELREVAVLFADVVGSTRLAGGRPPHQVLALLNEFFATVVEVVDRHGGWVNKFEGDAALAVFGAPASVPDAAGQALAAARELAGRLRERGGLEVAIGVSAGEALAGNVGDPRRFEYTVIGDPVNEAARLTELAKRRPGRLLASAAIVERAGEPEARRWRSDDTVTLRGRDVPTVLAVPA